MRGVIFFLSLFCFCLPARGEPPVWIDGGDEGQVRVHLYLFWSQTCPHCLVARPQIAEMAKRHPWIVLHEYEISQNESNASRFVELARLAGGEAQAVPSLVYCGRMDVGWDGGQESLSRLLTRLDACRRSGGVGRAPEAPRLILPLIGEVEVAQFSLPLMTVILAGLDAFNPCAFFVLLFLLSLLVHQQRPSRMLIIGGVFVACSGLMYFAFMSAWLNLFLLLGSLFWVTAAAGALALVAGFINIKDFFRFHRGASLSITEEGKASISLRAREVLRAGSLPAMLIATAVLAVAANFYELLCTSGFPMVFTRLLTLQARDRASHYLYLALYNVIYVLPLLAIVVAFVRTMGARRLSEREGRLLKLFSGLMMSGLGGMLLLMPEALDSLGMGLLVSLAAVMITWTVARLTRQQEKSKDRKTP